MKDTLYIYVVVGSTTDSSGYSTRWLVCAYLEEHLALKHCELASNEAASIFSDLWVEAGEQDIPNGVNPFDPMMQMDSMGTCYKAFRTELKGTLEFKGCSLS